MTQGEEDQGTTFAPEAPSANEEESDPTGDVGVTCGRVDVARVAGAGVSGGERLSGRAGVGGGRGLCLSPLPSPPLLSLFFPFLFLFNFAGLFLFFSLDKRTENQSISETAGGDRLFFNFQTGNFVNYPASNMKINM